MVICGGGGGESKGFKVFVGDVMAGVSLLDVSLPLSLVLYLWEFLDYLTIPVLQIFITMMIVMAELCTIIYITLHYCCQVAIQGK